MVYNEISMRFTPRHSFSDLKERGIEFYYWPHTNGSIFKNVGNMTFDTEEPKLSEYPTHIANFTYRVLLSFTLKTNMESQLGILTFYEFRTNKHRRHKKNNTGLISLKN